MKAENSQFIFIVFFHEVQSVHKKNAFQTLEAYISHSVDIHPFKLTFISIPTFLFPKVQFLLETKVYYFCVSWLLQSLN